MFWLRCLVLLSLLAANAARGAAARAPETAAAADLAGTWQLIAVDGTMAQLPGDLTFVAPAVPYTDTLRIIGPNEASVHAYAGCNFIFTQHMARPVDEFRFAQVNSSLMLCDDNRVNQHEGIFMERMGATARYHLSADPATLSLQDASGHELLRFSRGGLTRVFVPLIVGR